MERSDAFRVQWDRPRSLHDCAVWKNLMSSSVKYPNYDRRLHRAESLKSPMRVKRKINKCSSITQSILRSYMEFGKKTSMALTQNEIIRHYSGQTKDPKY